MRFFVASVVKIFFATNYGTDSVAVAGAAGNQAAPMAFT
jgi:hypothetical protein